MSSNNGNNVGNKIYSGAASFGLAWSFIGAIICTIFAVLMIFVGIYMLSVKMEKIPAKVTDVTDKEITVNFSYNDKQYQRTISSNKKSYTVGENIDICINEKDENVDNATVECNPKKTAGLLFLGAIVLGGFGWFWYWVVRRWKFLAAAQGVSGAVRLL
jgi:hypothetical protein